MELVHGLYDDPSAIRVQFGNECRRLGVEVEQFRWDGSPLPPEFVASDPEVAVVLVPSLGSLDKTCLFARDMARAQFPAFVMNEELAFDADRFALIDGRPFKPHTLRWVRMKLDAYGQQVNAVRSPTGSPAHDMFFLAAQHPERIRAIGRRTSRIERKGLLAPGLKCTAIAAEPFRHVPTVDFDPRPWSDLLVFGAHPEYESSEGLVVPAYVN
jgi:hypothetical protein